MWNHLVRSGVSFPPAIRVTCFLTCPIRARQGGDAFLGPPFRRVGIQLGEDSGLATFVKDVLGKPAVPPVEACAKLVFRRPWIVPEGNQGHPDQFVPRQQVLAERDAPSGEFRAPRLDVR